MEKKKNVCECIEVHYIVRGSWTVGAAPRVKKFFLNRYSARKGDYSVSYAQCFREAWFWFQRHCVGSGYLVHKIWDINGVKYGRLYKVKVYDEDNNSDEFYIDMLEKLKSVVKVNISKE